MTPFGSYASMAGTFQAPGQDVHALTDMLSSLMPLLSHFRSLTQGQGQGQQSQTGTTQFDTLNVMIPNPMLDHQAAVNLVEDITADSLRRLSAYLEANATRHEGLEGCVSIVTQAVNCFGMRDYSGAFDLIWQTYRLVATARAANPSLPPLRSTETSQAAAAENAPIH